MQYRESFWCLYPTVTTVLVSIKERQSGPDVSDNFKSIGLTGKFRIQNHTSDSGEVPDKWTDRQVNGLTDRIYPRILQAAAQ